MATADGEVGMCDMPANLRRGACIIHLEGATTWLCFSIDRYFGNPAADPNVSNTATRYFLEPKNQPLAAQIYIQT